jgi:hypothetical protein
MLVRKVLQCVSVFSHESACLYHNNSLVPTNFYSPKSQNKFYTQTQRERERYERERERGRGGRWRGREKLRTKRAWNLDEKRG